MTRQALPTRTLAAHPDLAQLKRQAKELLEAFLSGAPDATSEVNALYHDATVATFALHDSQLVLARAYGFESWPKLKAHVDGITVQRLADAVRADDLATVRSMLGVRPELAERSVDFYQMVHLAVCNRSSEMVRLLMRNGASARQGVYPYRDSTTALTIASERGYEEIVAIIHEEEQRRLLAKTGVSHESSADELFKALRTGSVDRAIALMQADPTLIDTCDPFFEWTPLHVAARTLNADLVLWLLDFGANVHVRDRLGHTPLNLAARFSRHEHAAAFTAVAKGLLGRSAELTADVAAALGDAEWFRVQHASGSLTNPIEDQGGLLRIAVSHNRPDILSLLLGFGFDPDERTRFQAVGDPDFVVFNWGMPLWECASKGRHEMAERLLERGADPNADVYASGTPVYEAFRQADPKMIALLERYGGVVDAHLAGSYGLADCARQLLAETINDSVNEAGQDVAAQLLDAATERGHVEIARLALDRVRWTKDHERWFPILEKAIRHAAPLDSVRLVLPRCNPNMQGRGSFGVTLLHTVAGTGDHVDAEKRLAFATLLLDAGASLNLRDNLLKSTPLAWACRWGHTELVKLFLERAADPVEADAEPWATPQAWAQRRGHTPILDLLRKQGV